MKNILLKIATYIFKKYDIIPMIDDKIINSKIKIGKNIYYIEKMTITQKFNSLPFIEIRCRDIMEALLNERM